MKNWNFACAGSMMRVGPKFGAWVASFFYISKGKNGRAYNY